MKLPNISKKYKKRNKIYKTQWLLLVILEIQCKFLIMILIIYFIFLKLLINEKLKQNLCKLLFLRLNMLLRFKYFDFYYINLEIMQKEQLYKSLKINEDIFIYKYYLQ